MKTVLLLLCTMMFGCNKDAGIKQSIAVNAKEELMYAGVNYMVQNGVVTLAGNCPGEELKTKLIAGLRPTGGVKNVVDHIAIGPVVVDRFFIETKSRQCFSRLSKCRIASEERSGNLKWKCGREKN